MLLNKSSKRRGLICVLMIVFTLVLLTVASPAFAAPADDPPVTMEFFNLAQLGTLAGVVAAVALFVQLTKFLIPVPLNPKWYCLFWSVAFSVAKLIWVTPPASSADYFTAVINVLIVMAAASGAYEFAIKPIERRVQAAKDAQLEQNE